MMITPNKKGLSDQPDELVAINLRRVPRTLRSQFKTLCAKEQITMELALLEMLEEAVESQSLSKKN